MSKSSDASVLHCPHCLREVGERSHFCTACGMPITSHSTIGPMEQVWALGWFVNRLLSQPPSAFTVVGVWLLAFPSLVVVLTVPLSVVFGARSGVFSDALIGLSSLLVACCYLTLAVRVTLSYLRHRPQVPRDPADRRV